MDIRSSTDGAQIPGISPTSTGPKLRISALKPNEIEALQKVFQGTFKLKVKGTSLMARKAEVVPDTQESVPAEVPAPAEQENEFSKLIDEINQGKYKVGFFGKFFTWLKNIFTGNYDIEVAKKAFSQINNQKEFLQAALEFIALQENENAIGKDMQLLLKLCQDNLESRKLFVEVLSGENPTLFNQLAMALANDKTSGGELLDQLLCWSVQLGSLRTDRWEPDQCKQLADTLLSAGDTGAIQLAELIVDRKLQDLKLDENQCKQLADTLLSAGDTGAIQLAELIRNRELLLKLDGKQVKALISALIEADSIYFPMSILNDHFSQLENFELDQSQRNNLVDITIRKASIWLRLLLERKEFANFTPDKNQCNAIAIALAMVGDRIDDRVKDLKKLLSGGKLPEFQLKGYNDHTTSKEYALKLLNQTPPDLTELKRLIDIKLDGLIDMGALKGMFIINTTTKELINIAKLNGLIDAAKSNKLIDTVESKGYIGIAELKSRFGTGDEPKGETAPNLSS